MTSIIHEKAFVPVVKRSPRKRKMWKRPILNGDSDASPFDDLADNPTWMGGRLEKV